MVTDDEEAAGERTAGVLIVDGDHLAAGRAPAVPADWPVVVVGGDPAIVSRRLGPRQAAWGHVPAGASSAVLEAARAAVAAGLVVSPPPATLVAAGSPAAIDEDGHPAEPLTPRELDVLQLVAEGLPNRAIAARLGISDHTVKFHLASVFGKLGVTTRTRAVRRGLSRGLIRI